MSIIIGANSYITVQEADDYITEHYFDTDEVTEKWFLLDEEEKEIVLKRASRSMNLWPFTGVKSSYNQTLAFPRYPSKTVPEEVKFAQVEEALFLFSNDPYNEYRARGVQRYSIGKLSETFFKGGEVIAKSPKATQLLAHYLGGGYDVSKTEHFLGT